MTKAELWLKRSLDTDGRLGGRGLYLLQQCPPVGEKNGLFMTSAWFTIGSLHSADHINKLNLLVSEQFCWLEKDFAKIVSTCEIAWSLPI